MLTLLDRGDEASFQNQDTWRYYIRPYLLSQSQDAYSAEELPLIHQTINDKGTTLLEYIAENRPDVFAQMLLDKSLAQYCFKQRPYEEHPVHIWVRKLGEDKELSQHINTKQAIKKNFKQILSSYIIPRSQYQNSISSLHVSFPLFISRLIDNRTPAPGLD